MIDFFDRIGRGGERPAEPEFIVPAPEQTREEQSLRGSDGNEAKPEVPLTQPSATEVVVEKTESVGVGSEQEKASESPKEILNRILRAGELDDTVKKEGPAAAMNLLADVTDPENS